MHNKINPHELLLENKSLREQLDLVTQTKNDLLIHKQQLDAILDNAPLEVYLKDRQGGYIRVNKQFEKSCGVKNEEVVGLLPMDIHSPEFAASVRNHDLAVLNSGKTEWRKEMTRLVGDGQLHTLLTVKFPVWNTNGEVDGLGAIVTNITAQAKIEDKLRQSYSEIRQAEQALQQSNMLFNQAETMGNMGHYCWDLVEDRLISCSDQFARIYEMSVPEVLAYFTSAAAALDLIHPDDKEIFRQGTYFYNQIATEIDLEYRIITLLGNTRYIHVRKDISPDSQGLPSQSFGTVVDITKRKQAEDKLKISTDDLESFFNLSAYMVCIASPEGYFIKVSPAFTETLGFSEKELFAKPFADLVHPDQKEITLKTLGFLRRGMPITRHLNRYICKDGSYKWLEWTARSFVHAGNIYAIAYDVTERKIAEEKLEKIALYDVLTNLPNRVLLADRLSQAMVQCKRRNLALAVVFMDLDGFKAVNDSYGHNVGDELLIALSKRMKSALRKGDTLARIGGDEFIAILVDLKNIEDSEPSLQRLLTAAAEPVTLGDAVIQVSASIGVTLYPQDAADADKLIRHADQAMYVAKQAGKNRYHLFDIAQDNAVTIV